MKKIFIKPLNRLCDFDDKLLVIKFEDPIIYREFTFDIINNLNYSENNSIIDLEKYGNVIYNPYDLNLTEKKLVNALYSILQNNIKDNEIKIINEIEKKLIELLNVLFQKVSVPFEYNEGIDVSKLFLSIGVRYPIVSKASYFENLLLYIKIYVEVLHIKCFITLNLTNLLSSEEQNKLKLYLKELDIVLIDCFVESKNNSNLIIDSDWCSI